MTRAKSLLENLSGKILDEANKPDEHGFIAGNKAKNVQTAAKHVEALGHKAEIYRKPGSPSAAVYSNGKVHINASHKFWSDPAAGQAHNHKIGHLSSDHPLHVIHHEIGHALYDPPDNFSSLSDQDKARKEVSKYAAMNPKELVSEVHAGMRAGRTFPPEIMAMFNRYAKPREGIKLSDDHLPPHLRNLKND